MKNILFFMISVFLCNGLCAQHKNTNVSKSPFGGQKHKTVVVDNDSAIVYSQGYQFKKNQIKLNNGYFTIPNVPDGNYRVHLQLGGGKASNTVVRGESRRLFFENIETEKGEIRDLFFTINKRDTVISENKMVKIKPRERMKLNWDSNLTLEFSGNAPQVQLVEISKIDSVPTIFLCGNSTVVDQDNEPWASWGQMLPRFLDKDVCVANYAESGESSNTFISALRLEKIASQMKAGDYIFMEFGHNDEKQRGEDKGPYKHFQKALRQYINLAREKGATPVLVTPTQRRKFDSDGHLIDTHGEFPAAIKALAKEENVALIDLQQMTTLLFEALGDEPSKKAFVHYPAGTYPGQDKALEDNTHFNPYGAYQIAKCIVEGIRKANLPLADHIVSDYKSFDPAKPDDVAKFVWYDAVSVDLVKPDGN